MTNFPEKKHTFFVSSTFEDLVEEREHVVKAILQAAHIPIGMELFPAGPDESLEYIKRQIDNCDYYLLIIAGRYGSIHPATGKSYTELEYDYAIEKGIPVIAILRKNVTDIPAKLTETSDLRREQVEQFREKAKSNSIVSYWDSKNDLEARVLMAVFSVRTSHPRPGYIRNEFATKPPVVRFSSHEEQANFFAQRLETASSIQDLTWAKARSKVETVHDAVDERRIRYVEDIARFSKEKPYMELFIFNDEHGFRKDRQEKLRYHYERCQRGEGGLYSCGYFVKADFPRLQYTLIDVDEILFTSGTMERLIVNQPELSSVFRKYFEYAWDDSTTLIDNGEIVDDGKIIQILEDLV